MLKQKQLRGSGTGAVRMTEGPIGKRIIFFAIPLFWGNLFQQLYNTADSLIVGNFLGSEALAAVSSSSSLIFLMVGFFNGVFVGSGVVVARSYGAKNYEKLQRAIHTGIALAVVSGLALTVIGMILSPILLRLMGTPAEVMVNSVAYFRTYFLGSLGFVLYNCMVGILQSVGDSKHPLYYLIISSIVNVILDIVFIAVFNMGVEGAAYATVIAQFLSAGMCLVHLIRIDSEYKVYLSKIRFDREILGQILKFGIPTGIQNSIISLANVVVQSNINAFGKNAMAGCGSYSKVEGFGFLPVNCFSMSLTTFISQNLGAKEFERAKKGAFFGILCSATLAEVIGIIIYIFAPVLVGMFDSNPDVVAFGVTQARTVCLFYFMLAFSHCCAAILRGAGRAVIPMYVMLGSWCVLRITFITVIVKIFPVIRAVFWAYPLTWTVSSIIFLIYLLKSDWLYRY
ncbi:MAG: MATE family efflux transporter, partial [Oscillospiraceae bacterium]|nr:MATE family efflux transporter [Oscillospiraceae bacterium]